MSMGPNAYHHHSGQVCIHAARVLLSPRRRGALAPRRDVSVLFGQLRGVRTTGFELEHRFAEFDFAEEEEAGVAGSLRLAVVG